MDLGRGTWQRLTAVVLVMAVAAGCTGQGEGAGGRNDEDDNVNLFLASENGGCLQRVGVQTRGVDESDVDDSVVEKRFIHVPDVLDVDLAL